MRLHGVQLVLTLIAMWAICGTPFTGRLFRKSMQTPAFSILHSAATVCMTSVGIDLGTTYSLVSVLRNGSPHIVKVDGRTTMPSVVSFLSNGSTIVGESAEQLAAVDPSNSFASIKRIIGKSSPDIVKLKEKQFMSKLAKSVQPGATGRVLFCPAQQRSIAPEDVSAEVLRRLIGETEAYLRAQNLPSKVTNAVITVPAYFSKAQRAATERAGKLAGLDKVRLLREPEAAAMAYGLNRQQRQLVLVFDLGGGTLDVSVLEVGEGLVEVIATNGDAHLGGDDFDQLIVEWMLHQFARTEGVTVQMVQQVRGDVLTLARLRETARDVKQRLSTASEVLVELPRIHPGSGLGVFAVLTRQRFESLSVHLLSRLLKPLRELAIMARINLPGESGRAGLRSEDHEEDEGDSEKEEVHHAINSNRASFSSVLSSEELRRQQTEGRADAKQEQKLLGSTMKELRRLQRTAASTASTALHGDSYASTAGARSSKSGGAGQTAGVSGGGNVNLFPTGRAIDAVLLVGGSTRIPCVRRTVRTLTGVEALSSHTVNPDEAVCLGAGILAGMLDGLIPDMQILSPWQAAVLRVVHEEKLKGNVLLPLKGESAEGNSDQVDSGTQVALSEKKRTFPSLRRSR